MSSAIMGATSGLQPLTVQFLDWDWVRDNRPEIIGDLLEHVQLTVLAMMFGFVIAFPLALAAFRWPRLYGPVIGFTGVLFTIPSLALFVILIPFTGLSIVTPLTGLTIFTLLVLVRNIVEGLRGVDPQVREAAQAMGYRRTRQLLTVELPLALPVIMAGIRIATVTTIGLIAITALIGWGGLGQLFLQGLTLYRPTAIMTGFVLSVAFAVTADLLLVGVQRALTPWTRRAEG